MVLVFRGETHNMRDTRRFIRAAVRVYGFLALWACSVAVAAAGGLKEIELADGSVVRAEVLSYANGVYQLRSDTLGNFSLHDDKVRSIRSQAAGGQQGNGFKNPVDAKNRNELQGIDRQQVQSQVQNLTNRMMSDPETMQMIQQLENDPSVQQVLKDPELMRAISQQDLARLSQDPKIQSLMNSRAVGDILNKSAR
jgi:hypothetical protein